MQPMGSAKFQRQPDPPVVCLPTGSLATDSVFREAQLVSCRNVLIYFDRALRGPRHRPVP